MSYPELPRPARAAGESATAGANRPTRGAGESATADVHRPAATSAATVPLPRPAEASNLLYDLLKQPLEPGYAAAARRRAEFGPRTGWRAAGARTTSLVTAVLVGFLLTVAYQQVVAVEPEATKARADLVADVRERRSTADDLQRRADALRAEVARRGDDVLADDEVAATLRSRAAAAGLGRVAGDGAVVRLADADPEIDPVTGRDNGENPGIVLDRDLQDVANALWRLGAEAIAINGQRLTATTTIRAAGGAILVDFHPITSPYEVAAIGPGDLADKFDDSATAKRFRRYVKTYRMRFSIKERDDLTLPAAPEPRLRYAQPVPPRGSRGATASGPAAGTSGGQQRSVPASSAPAKAPSPPGTGASVGSGSGGS